MLRDNLVELIEPMLNSAGADPLALRIHNLANASDDRLPCLENPRPEGAEPSLTENAASPVQAEPRHPDNRISGGKVLKRGTRHVVNRASTALRLAALSLLRSQSALGAKFRRLRSRLGAPKAITAMAHMLARLLYRMLKFGHEYVDRGTEFYETKYRQQQLQRIAKQAAALHMQLVPLTEVAN